MLYNTTTLIIGIIIIINIIKPNTLSFTYYNSHLMKILARRGYS